MRMDNGGEVTSTTGLQHLPDLRLRVVLERASSKRSHRNPGPAQAHATLTLEGRGTMGRKPEVEVALV